MPLWSVFGQLEHIDDLILQQLLATHVLGILSSFAQKSLCGRLMKYPIVHEQSFPPKGVWNSEHWTIKIQYIN
jgi:hypothetical protein